MSDLATKARSLAISLDDWINDNDVFISALLDSNILFSDMSRAALRAAYQSFLLDKFRAIISELRAMHLNLLEQTRRAVGNVGITLADTKIVQERIQSPRINHRLKVLGQTDMWQQFVARFAVFEKLLRERNPDYGWNEVTQPSPSKLNPLQSVVPTTTSSPLERWSTFLSIYITKVFVPATDNYNTSPQSGPLPLDVFEAVGYAEKRLRGYISFITFGLTITTTISRTDIADLTMEPKVPILGQEVSRLTSVGSNVHLATGVTVSPKSTILGVRTRFYPQAIFNYSLKDNAIKKGNTNFRTVELKDLQAVFTSISPIFISPLVALFSDYPSPYYQPLFNKIQQGSTPNCLIIFTSPLKATLVNNTQSLLGPQTPLILPINNATIVPMIRPELLESAVASSGGSFVEIPPTLRVGGRINAQPWRTTLSNGIMTNKTVSGILGKIGTTAKPVLISKSSWIELGHALNSPLSTASLKTMFDVMANPFSNLFKVISSTGAAPGISTTPATSTASTPLSITTTTTTNMPSSSVLSQVRHNWIELVDLSPGELVPGIPELKEPPLNKYYELRTQKGRLTRPDVGVFIRKLPDLGISTLPPLLQSSIRWSVNLEQNIRERRSIFPPNAQLDALRFPLIHPGTVLFELTGVIKERSTNNPGEAIRSYPIRLTDPEADEDLVNPFTSTELKESIRRQFNTINASNLILDYRYYSSIGSQVRHISSTKEGNQNRRLRFLAEALTKSNLVPEVTNNPNIVTVSWLREQGINASNPNNPLDQFYRSALLLLGQATSSNEIEMPPNVVILEVFSPLNDGTIRFYGVSNDVLIPGDELYITHQDPNYWKNLAVECNERMALFDKNHPYKTLLGLTNTVLNFDAYMKSTDPGQFMGEGTMSSDTLQHIHNGMSLTLDSMASILIDNLKGVQIQTERILREDRVDATAYPNVSFLPINLTVIPEPSSSSFQQSTFLQSKMVDNRSVLAMAQTLALKLVKPESLFN